MSGVQRQSQTAFFHDAVSSGQFAQSNDSRLLRVLTRQSIRNCDPSQTKDQPKIFFRPHWVKPLKTTLPTLFSAQSPQTTRR